jgi:AraC-like DNA-binding protein
LVRSAHTLDEVARSRYRERPAHPAVARFVTCVFTQETAPGTHPYDHRLVPNGSAELAWRIGSTVPVVTGPRRTPEVATIAPGASIVGVRFRPGAAASILGIPASELVGRREDLDRIWSPTSAISLGSRLAEAPTLGSARDMLEREMIAISLTAPNPDPLVEGLVELLQPWRTSRVADRTSDLFLSPRQLRRRCQDALGFGPKFLHRVLRLQGFLALVDRWDNVGLARLAAKAGYSDQAHLTRECVRLAGLAPRAFVQALERDCRGAHDHAASFRQLHRALMAA